jgi:hypothetical protein
LYYLIRRHLQDNSHLTPKYAKQAKILYSEGV